MKINIVVGGTFHFPLLAEKLLDLEHDVKIYTSTPKYRFINKKYYDNIVYIPMIFQLYRKVTNNPLPSFIKYIDLELFDKLISVFMRKCDILYGWAGCSLYSGRKTIRNGGVYILDRACPHIQFQSELLIGEAKALNVNFYNIKSGLLARSLQEYDLASCIVTPSSYSSNTFLERGFTKNKIRIIPLEAKIALPAKKLFDAKLEHKQRDIIFCSVGGGLLRKGYIYLFRAWDNLNLLNAKLYIKTNINELKDNKEIVEILRKNKNIKIFRFFNNINDFYEMCDVFCLPSIDDGFGMVVPEAMANSLPCMVTTNVGASFLIKNKHNGIVIKPQSTKELEDSLLYFYNNPQEIKNMGRNAYDDYLLYYENNDYKRNINSLLNYAEKMLHGYP